MVGIPFAFIYYYVFKTYLAKKQISIEVAESDDEDEGPSALSLDDQQKAKSYRIIEGLGGFDNIVEVNNCLTRLRVDLVDPSKVREDILKKTGSNGFIRPSEKHIQVVYGPKVEGIAANVRECLKAGKGAAEAFAAAHKNDGAGEVPAAKSKAAPAQKSQLAAPVGGKVLPMSEAKDENFAAGILGGGVVIQPTEDVIVAPCDGTVTHASDDNKHAVGLESAAGVEVLIHIGVDTVSMNGEGFTLLKKEGDPVKAGEALVRFDKKLIESKGLCSDVMLIVLESDEELPAEYITGVTAQAGKTVLAKLG